MITSTLHSVTPIPHPHQLTLTNLHQTTLLHSHYLTPTHSRYRGVHRPSQTPSCFLLSLSSGVQPLRIFHVTSLIRIFNAGMVLFLHNLIYILQIFISNTFYRFFTLLVTDFCYDVYFKFYFYFYFYFYSFLFFVFVSYFYLFVVIIIFFSFLSPVDIRIVCNM